MGYFLCFSKAALNGIKIILFIQMFIQVIFSDVHLIIIWALTEVPTAVKNYMLSWKIGGAESPLPKDPYWVGNLGLRYRFSDKFQFSTKYGYCTGQGKLGLGFSFSNPDGSPIIARRNVKTNTAIVSGQYNFTSRMNLNIRMRHYWSF